VRALKRCTFPSKAGRKPLRKFCPGEFGLADADYTFWIGLFAPSKTPRAIIDRIYNETVAAMRAASLREKLHALSVAPMPMAPAEFDAFVRDEISSNVDLVKAAGVVPG